MANYECENRISDDEIISSLEVIATTRNCSECKIRNCNWGDCNCSQITANAALDLINRQKAEIERLKGIFISPSKDPMDFCGVLCDYAEELIDKAKSEAYKEFAERLNEKLCDCHIVSDGEYCGFDCSDVHECVDNLVKEMVGED